MQERCGTCKYWDRDNPILITKLGGERVSSDHCQCLAIVHGNREETENKAYCVDGSDYFAAVRTKESFGCVLYERI